MGGKRFPRNWKKEFGLTLEEAKQVALEKNGHLPRPGWETCVIADTQMADIGYGSLNYQEVDHRVYLVNRAGTFELWQWWDVNLTKKNSSVGVGDETTALRQAIRLDEHNIMSGIADLLRRYNEKFVDLKIGQVWSMITLFQTRHGFQFSDEKGAYYDFDYFDDLLRFVESCVLEDQPADVKSGRVSPLKSLS